MLKYHKYALAFEISPVPMLLVSCTGEIVLTNALLDQLFGYEPTSLIGENVETLVPESIRAHHPDLRSAYFKAPAKRNMGQGRDLNGIKRSGQVIPLELGLDTVMIDGQLYALVIALDIQQRQEHEQRMHLAMDAAASAMIMVDSDGNVVFVNKAASVLFGYEEYELMGTPIERLVPKNTQRAHPVYRESFMSASKARPMAKELELYALHRNGNEIPVEIALTPVETPNGKKVVCTIIDLSERVSAASVIAEKSEALARVNDELSQFAYSASHDLKAPISTMVGLVNLCIEDLNEGNLEEVRENLQKIAQIGSRSAEKVEKVLEIANVERNPIAAEKIILADIIQDMWLDLSGANNDNIQLLLDLNHTDPVILELNTLKVILENLLSNALRYCDREKPTRKIKVSSECVETDLIISIKDNGIGIPQDRQDTVFIMFNRIDERSQNGLGLSLVKKQIDRLGGSIEFSSAKGKGTEFTISIPLLDGDRGEK